MSTQYLIPQPPITKLDPVIEGNHVRLHIWINGNNAGSIVLRGEELRDIQDVFFEQVDDRRAAAYKDGVEGGYRVRWNAEAVDAPALYPEGRMVAPTTLEELIHGAAVALPWDEDEASFGSIRAGCWQPVRVDDEQLLAAYRELVDEDSSDEALADLRKVWSAGNAHDAAKAIDWWGCWAPDNGEMTTEQWVLRFVETVIRRAGAAS